MMRLRINQSGRPSFSWLASVRDHSTVYTTPKLITSQFTSIMCACHQSWSQFRSIMWACWQQRHNFYLTELRCTSLAVKAVKSNNLWWSWIQQRHGFPVIQSSRTGHPWWPATEFCNPAGKAKASLAPTKDVITDRNFIYEQRIDSCHWKLKQIN